MCVYIYIYNIYIYIYNTNKATDLLSELEGGRPTVIEEFGEGPAMPRAAEQPKAKGIPSSYPPGRVHVNVNVKVNVNLNVIVNVKV